MNFKFFWTLLFICISTILHSEKALALESKTEFRHVHLMHIDGLHSQIFEKLIKHGSLPNFSKLLTHGKKSYLASTVDKSETMKVIESYLTSKRETSIVGWWQFSRDDFQFKNYWLDPIEVINYALGLEFPVYPSIYDFLRSEGKYVGAGFSLHRRGIDFTHYTRNYVDGIKAVFKHTYYNQAHRTMDKVLGLYDQMYQERKFPVLMTSLLAAADEFCHLKGVIRDQTPASSDSTQVCYSRSNGLTDAEKIQLEPVFRILEHYRKTEPDLFSDLSIYFKNMNWSYWGKLQSFCFDIPAIEVQAEENNDTYGTRSLRYAQPFYVLGFIWIDIEVGRLIQKLKQIKIDSKTTAYDRTLFVLTGDHGMVDTRKMMWPKTSESNPHPDPSRDKDSQDSTWLEYLNAELGIDGVDDAHLPTRLQYSHKFLDWQNNRIKNHTNQALIFAESVFNEFKDKLRTELHSQYWWLFFLKSWVVDPKLDHKLKDYKQSVVDILARLYLKGIPEFKIEEQKANQKYYNEKIRLVYGGGARNNAEIFLPSITPLGTYDWAKRPSFDEILNFRPNPKSQSPSLLQALLKNSGVGLVFIRANNELFSSAKNLPVITEILVLDRLNNKGWIKVWKDKSTKEFLFSYSTDPMSKSDPLMIAQMGFANGKTGTYSEWNHWSIQNRFYYHNVVAGIGSLLHSNNPSLGDVLVTHRSGWNFGENAGGHGGVHWDEKITTMIVSSPQMKPGTLQSLVNYKTKATGKNIEVVEEDWLTYPTVLDIAPSVLTWLGYSKTALTEFSQSRFEHYLRQWVGDQKSDIVNHLDDLSDFNEAMFEIGVTNIKLSQFKDKITRLLEVLPQEIPKLPDFSDEKQDGNLMMFDR